MPDLSTLRRVAVGSANPVKLAAARAVLARVAPEAEVVGVEVASGVPAQPWGDDETRRGALTRARRLHAGEELGHAIDAPTGESGTKHRGGAVAVLTGGLVDRRQAYEVILAYALAPFLAPPD
jgi:non-canonical (house-cleaning) NTP pyrophosphatase